MLTDRVQRPFLHPYAGLWWIPLFNYRFPYILCLFYSRSSRAGTFLILGANETDEKLENRAYRSCVLFRKRVGIYGDGSLCGRFF